MALFCRWICFLAFVYCTNDKHEGIFIMWKKCREVVKMRWLLLAKPQGMLKQRWRWQRTAHVPNPEMFRGLDLLEMRSSGKGLGTPTWPARPSDKWDVACPVLQEVTQSSLYWGHLLLYVELEQYLEIRHILLCGPSGRLIGCSFLSNHFQTSKDFCFLHPLLPEVCKFLHLHGTPQGPIYGFNLNNFIIVVVVTQLYSTFCNPTDCSMLGFSVLHYLLKFAQTSVHWVGDAIQPSHPLPPPPHALNLSQHQGLFQWVSSSHQVAEVLELQLQYQSFQWIFRVDFL